MPSLAGEDVGVVGGLLELGGMEARDQRRDVEDRDPEGIVGAELEPVPSRDH